MANFETTRADRVVAYGVFIGTVLAVIGVRFVFWPEAAASTFGLADDALAGGFNHVIGFRDLWLGGLAIVFALQRAYVPLFWWLLGAACVCLGDAIVVAGNDGPWTSITFHVLSGVFTFGVGIASWLVAREPAEEEEAA